MARDREKTGRRVTEIGAGAAKGKAARKRGSDAARVCDESHVTYQVPHAVAFDGGPSLSIL